MHKKYNLQQNYNNSRVLSTVIFWLIKSSNPSLYWGLGSFLFGFEIIWEHFWHNAVQFVHLPIPLTSQFLPSWSLSKVVESKDILKCYANCFIQFLYQSQCWWQKAARSSFFHEYSFVLHWTASLTLSPFHITHCTFTICYTNLSMKFRMLWHFIN